MGAVTLTIIGTLASLIGALISIRQARAAKTAAQEAREARAQIIDHRKTSEATELKIACKKAQTAMEKYGPGSSIERIKENLVGTTPEGDAKEVQSFMLFIKENRLAFGSKNPNVADEFVGFINKVLGKFSQSFNSPENLKKYGTELLMKINAMSSVIKKQYDDKKEVKKRCKGTNNKG